jgi:nitrate/TMAO reductase-like tetraheme cytochrome c subunit
MLQSLSNSKMSSIFNLNRRATLKASGRLGSYFSVSIALTVWRNFDHNPERFKPKVRFQISKRPTTEIVLTRARCGIKNVGIDVMNLVLIIRAVRQCRSRSSARAILFLQSLILLAPQFCSAAADTNSVSEIDKPDPHIALLTQKDFPSAESCAPCHAQIYNEWRLSAHAYASISPMFHKFEQKITDLSEGTVGTFCVRCHATVGTTLGEKRELPLWDRSEVSREGVTCITCHRINEEYGRVNGERRIVPGDIHTPMTGAGNGAGLQTVLTNQAFYKVRTTPDARGKDIHTGVFTFPQIDQSEFCVGCHQVAVDPGIKLEVVWEQYRDSPAARQGITCQDCHMSKSPGKPDGFNLAPPAVVDGKAIEPDRPHHSHYFAGPGYPIAHPGIFPQNPDAKEFSIQKWLKFDYRAGWGDSVFEDQVSSGKIKAEFPKEWDSDIDREEARRIVDANLELINDKRELRRRVMENSSKIEGPFFSGEPSAGHSLKFDYKITNINPGHNMPSGSLGAQPEIWLDVALISPDGKNIWESGYVDSYGDMADLHSLDVAAGKIPRDQQLFNLQSKFLTTNVKGTDREMFLPINVDIDQLPFIRPATQPVSVLNHPPFVRMEQRSIPPLGSRTASYTVPASLLKQPGKYKLAVRLRSRAEPIYFMEFVGATREMEEAMNQWMLDIHPSTVEFEVK